MSYLGIDLHSNRFTVEQLMLGETVKTVRNTYGFDDTSFGRFKESLSKDDCVLVENTFNAFWFHDQIAERVDTCLVYNTNPARAEGNKTDKIDARHLVKKLTYYLMWGRREEDLPAVYIPDAEIRELRGLFTTYQLHKKTKVQMKNRIHSILKQNGICVERKAIDKKDFEARIDGIELAEVWKFQIRSALRALKKSEEEQQEIKDMIYLCGYRLFKEQIELLLSIRGFSALTAIALMSDVEGCESVFQCPEVLLLLAEDSEGEIIQPNDPPRTCQQTVQAADLHTSHSIDYPPIAGRRSFQQVLSESESG